MATVGIVTFHNSPNYGAILQTYALQKTLANMGYVAEAIDYLDSETRGRAAISRIHLARHLVRRIVAGILVGTKRKRRTEQFRRRHLRCSSHHYADAEAIHAEPPVYDAYMVGSDQVWNPRNSCNDPTFFLTFAPPGKRRIAYAASFGISKIPERYVDPYKERLKRIHYLSVRETQGRRIIERLTGRQAEVTLDPTLLLDRCEWSDVAVPFECRRPYILCYYMPGDNKVTGSITSIARRIGRATGYTRVRIGEREYMRLYPFSRSFFDAGPARFLGLFQNASCVVTNSFHGTAFAVIFRKPFLCPVNRHVPPERDFSSRITSLLEVLGLKHRCVPAGVGVPVEDAIYMDYRKAEARLDEEKQRSIDFLQNALQGL